MKNYNKLIKQAQSRYKFLKGITIDIDEGYGIEGATKYNDFQKSINLDLKALRAVFNTKRFVRRLGHHKTFDNFVLVILLHEIAHALQYQTFPVHKLEASVGGIIQGDAESHDECWVEIAADKWARKELKRWILCTK